MVDAVSTRVQLWRAAELDRDGAWGYSWRQTISRARGRRSWSEGVLLADPEGVRRVGPEVAGSETAAAVLGDVRALTGRLPVMVDLRFEQPPTLPAGLGHEPWGRGSRYDRPGRRGETLGERAARHRREVGDTNG
ncbi:MAG: hypothetical protein ACRD2C_18535 [Acidimicrobiales bacterium]